MVNEIMCKVFEWLIFLGLFVLSIFLTWEVFLNYKSKDSSFKISEEKIEKLPTIVVCFMGTKNTYRLGQEFDVTAYTSYNDYSKDFRNGLVFGEHDIDGHTLSIKNVDTTYDGKCLNLSTTTQNLSKDWRMYFAFKYNNVSLSEKEIPRLNIYLSSAENSYGLTLSVWQNGEVLRTTLDDKTTYQHIIIREERYQYLKQKSNCTSEPYYRCFAKKFLQSNSFVHCNAKCSTNKLDTSENALPICEKGSEEESCIRPITLDLSVHLRKNDICPLKKCIIEEYSGTVSYEEFSDSISYKKGFGYNFKPPEIVSVHEEYLIYDFVGMLSAAGGMLGLFVGFSFAGESQISNLSRM